jgi:hypothetical protein
MTDQALPIDQPEDIRRKLDEKAAVKRGTDWEKMGCPASEQHMPAEKYRKDYRGRIWCASKAVFEGVQQALRIIICPKCIKEESYGAIEGTRFFTSVEDDVMTVFPAVGHFVCHNCGFEEWHPLKHDPRKLAEKIEAQESATAMQIRRQQAMAGMQGMGMARGVGGQMLGGLSDFQSAMQNQLGQKISEGIDRGMGPIYGMTDDEQRALHRLYQNTAKAATSPPPKIVESKEEAEALLKLAPIERRQSIIQKLRDRGYL